METSILYGFNLMHNKPRHPELVSGSCQHTILDKSRTPQAAPSVVILARLGNKRRCKFGMIICAFTLAEVLITLGIIGVVASITIPTLMQNMADQQTVGMLKKEYSVLSQAYTLAVQESGTPDTWLTSSTSSDPASAISIVNTLSPFLRITKNCGTGAGCMPVPYKELNNNTNDIDTDTTMAHIQLSDGTLLAFKSYGWGNAGNNVGSTQALQNTVAAIWIDINGFKGPNRYGKDLFSVYLTKYGIIPTGTTQQTGDAFTSYCYPRGLSCAAWVIYNENRDYLKCSGLSWNGPTKCP